MDLPRAVYHHYLENKHLLDDSKLFHFGTRIAAWLGTPESYAILRASRAYIMPTQPSLEALLATIYAEPQTGRHKAHALRAPFFEKYPELYGAQLALFRVRHLREIYGIDASEALFSIIPKDTLIELRDRLLIDTPALRALSTFAVNYCYLLDTLLLGRPDASLRHRFLEVGRTYDTTAIEQVQLLMYLYTHCIIGESNFYVRTIPEDRLAAYHQMLHELEPLIYAHFTDISLDNKLEFLVCARICSYETGLFEKVYEECHKSVSPEGTFLIDTRHKTAHAKSNSLIASEHRNVLFIMSATPYSPYSTLVG